jgi:hypothetical protein
MERARRLIGVAGLCRVRLSVRFRSMAWNLVAEDGIEPSTLGL